MIPFHDWKKCEREGFRTRDAHFMQEFIKHPDIDTLLIINRPISFSEIVLFRRRVYAQHSKLIARCGSAYLCQIEDRVYTLDVVIPEIIRPLMMRRRWTSYIFGQPRVLEAVRFALRYLKIETSYHLFMSAPLFVPLAQQLKPRALILDAQDNLLKHALYRNVPHLSDYYAYCQRHADLLFTNSSQNAAWLGQQRPDVTYIPNGVDGEMFRPGLSHSMPADLQAIPRPIVGYAGKMQEMLDIELIEQMARRFPHVTFVFIGQQLNTRWVKHLWSLPNVCYLGDKQYSTLPSYLNAFDICMIPYHPERQHGGDPIKFYEYLAMGKPIVTTNIGGVSAFSDYPQVHVARDHQDFLAGLATFVEHVQERRPVAIQPLPQECLWSSKAARILQAIKSVQEETGSHAPGPVYA